MHNDLYVQPKPTLSGGRRLDWSIQPPPIYEVSELPGNHVAGFMIGRDNATRSASGVGLSRFEPRQRSIFRTKALDFWMNAVGCTILKTLLFVATAAGSIADGGGDEVAPRYAELTRLPRAVNEPKCLHCKNRTPVVNSLACLIHIDNAYLTLASNPSHGRAADRLFPALSEPRALLTLFHQRDRYYHDTTSRREAARFADQNAWRGFQPGSWCRSIDVRDFVVRNVTPYLGDAMFLASPSERTKAVWAKLQPYFKDEQKRGVLDVDASTPSTLLAHKAGFIDKATKSLSACRRMRRSSEQSSRSVG